MSRRTLGVFTAVVAVLLVVGVAWASGDSAPTSSTAADQTGSSVTSDDGSTSTTAGGATTTSLDDGTVATGAGGSSTTNDDNSTTTSPGGSSSTTVPGGSSSTTNDDNSSTTVPGGTSSTTNDDNSGVEDGINTYTVGSAGSVTIEVRSGELILIKVTTNSGWTYVVKKELPDAIDVRFEKGESEAEIEVDIEGGELVVTIS